MLPSLVSFLLMCTKLLPLHPVIFCLSCKRFDALGFQPRHHKVHFSPAMTQNGLDRQTDGLIRWPISVLMTRGSSTHWWPLSLSGRHSNESSLYIKWQSLCKEIRRLTAEVEVRVGEGRAGICLDVCWSVLKCAFLHSLVLYKLRLKEFRNSRIFYIYYLTLYRLITNTATPSSC